MKIQDRPTPNHILLYYKPSFLIFALLCLTSLVSSCFFPEKFEVTININNNGTYSINYDGILTYLPAKAAAVQGQLTTEDEREMKEGGKEIFNDPDFKESRYIGNGQFMVLYESKGVLNSSVSFFGKSLEVISITPFSDKTVEIKGIKLPEDAYEQLRMLNMKIDGKIIITTNSKVLKHNAKSRPSFFGLFNSYNWQIKSINDPAPYMLLELDTEGLVPTRKQTKVNSNDLPIETLSSDTGSHSKKEDEPYPASTNSNKSNLILGSWESEIGMIEYFKDGTFMLHTATGEYKKKAGKWNINRDILTLRYYIHPKPYKYKILELSAATYKIVGISVDKNTYKSSRIDSSKQLSVDTTEKYKKNLSKVRVSLVTNYGSFTLELYPKKAPKTVDNFLQYVKNGFYDGTIFHRVIKGFMIQGGGLNENMRQKPARDPINNEGSNGLMNLRGTVAMARSNGPHSSTSQFFINTAKNTSLDYKGKNAKGWGYCVFGKVVDGMDVISTIENLPTRTEGEFNDVPVNQVIIESIKVDNKSQQSNSAPSGNNKKSDVSNKVSSSVFATNTSNIYHKSNCPELGTKDLMEFNSPKKARKSGGVPCENCNP